MASAEGRQKELLAGVIVYDSGEVVHTQYIAASDKGKQCGALDKLLVYLIDDKYSGRRWFDSGTSNKIRIES